MRVRAACVPAANLTHASCGWHQVLNERWSWRTSARSRQHTLSTAAV